MTDLTPSRRQHESTEVGQGHDDGAELPLLEGWRMHTSRGGEVFFHHFDTGKTQSARPTAPLPRYCPQRSAQQEPQRLPVASDNQHHGKAATAQPVSVYSGMSGHDTEGHGAQDQNLNNHLRGDGFRKTFRYANNDNNRERRPELPPSSADTKRDSAAARGANDHAGDYNTGRVEVLIQEFSVRRHLPVSPIKPLASRNPEAPSTFKHSPVHVGEQKLSTPSNLNSDGTGVAGENNGSDNQYAAAGDQSMSPPSASTGNGSLRRSTKGGDSRGNLFDSAYQSVRWPQSAGHGRRRRTTSGDPDVLEGDDGDTGGRRPSIGTLKLGRHGGHGSGTDGDCGDFERYRLDSWTKPSGEEMGSPEGGWNGSGNYGEGRTTVRSWMAGEPPKHLFGDTGGRIGGGRNSSFSAGLTCERQRERPLAAKANERHQATVQRALASAMVPRQIMGKAAGGSGGGGKRETIGISQGGLHVRDLKLKAGLAPQHEQCCSDDAHSELVDSITPTRSGTDHGDSTFSYPSATPGMSTIESYLESYNSREKRGAGKRSGSGEWHKTNVDGKSDDEPTKVRSKILTAGKKDEQESTGHPSAFSAHRYYSEPWETPGTSTATLDDQDGLLANEDELSQSPTSSVGVCDSGPEGDKSLPTSRRQGGSGSGIAAGHEIAPRGGGEGIEKGLQDRNTADNRNCVLGLERATEKRIRAERGREQRRRPEIEPVTEHPIQSPSNTRRDMEWSPRLVEEETRREGETGSVEDRGKNHIQGHGDERIEGATLDRLSERGRTRSQDGSRSNSRCGSSKSRQRFASRDDPLSCAVFAPPDICRYSPEHAVDSAEENGREGPSKVTGRRATVGSMPQEAPLEPITPEVAMAKRNSMTPGIGVVGKILATAGIRSASNTPRPKSERARVKSLATRASSRTPASVAGGWGNRPERVPYLDGPRGYREFVAKRFSKANGGSTALLRVGGASAKFLTELMSHSTVDPKQSLLSSTPRHLSIAARHMFQMIKLYMGDAEFAPGVRLTGDESTLEGIVEPARRNMHLATELYSQLLKQTHRCPFKENEERGFEIIAVAAVLSPPPTVEMAQLVLGQLALHRQRPDTVGGLALFTHNHLSTNSKIWKPVLETDPMEILSTAMRTYAKNCFVPGTVFGGTLADVLRQEYYAQGVGEVTSPAPSDAFATARVPVVVQLLAQTIQCLGGVRTEGIFRRSGHAGAQAALRDAVHAGDYAVLRKLRDNGRLDLGDLQGDNALHVDVYTVADTLKAWLRCMEEPLVPADSYNRAVHAGLVHVGGNVGQAQEEALRTMLALPPPSSATLDFLARFLHKIAGEEGGNRMDVRSLALVLSPNILRNPDGNPLTFKANANAETAFVQSLIEGSKQ